MAEPIHPALLAKLETLAARLHELERQSEDAALVRDPHRSREHFREIGRLRRVVAASEEAQRAWRDLCEAEELMAGDDEDLRLLAEAEQPAQQDRYDRARTALETLLLSDDEQAERNAILEIRAGTGGEEAGLFARDLARMYQRFCERMGWKMEAISLSESDRGGFKEAIFEVSGQDVFRYMRFEMGGHRVQRVPETEAQGRIHTSAATVAVLPEAEEVDLVLDPKDLEIQTTTASGPGGQHVNKTQSAVRITHRPSGLAVFCQEERSQHKNKARAMQLLRTRLYDLEQQRRHEERAETRRTQVGSGDRSQRIRTYNFPQNRVTDHRIGENYSLEKVIDGDLEALLADLMRHERAEKLRHL